MSNKALKRPYKLIINGERTRTYKTRVNRFKAALKLSVRTPCIACFGPKAVKVFI